MLDSSVCIIGGSFTGLVTALALHRRGFDVTLIERSAQGTQEDVKLDGRGHAIAAAGKAFLTDLGLWDEIAPYAAPIEHIRVTDMGCHGSISRLQMHLHAHEVGDETPMGWITENLAVRGIIYRAVKAVLKERLIEGAAVEDINYGPASVRLQLSNNESYKCALVLGCDGRNSTIRQMVGIRKIGWSYNQIALVGCVEHEKPHNNWAYEHFTAQGPLAFLPLPDGPQGRNRSSLVWTRRPREGEMLKAMNDEAYAVALNSVFGSWLGTLTPVGPRWAYPLSAMHARDYVSKRVALIGDAAHGIHPIAGQGFNLALRDIETLCSLLEEGRRLGLDRGDMSLLRRYERTRRADNTLMLAATDILDKTFSNNLPPLRLVRDFGLAAINRMPRLKARFIRYAMGN